MQYGKYQFISFFETEAELPPYKGSTFRGVFGIARPAYCSNNVFTRWYLKHRPCANRRPALISLPRRIRLLSNRLKPIPHSLRPNLPFISISCCSERSTITCLTLFMLLIRWAKSAWDSVSTDGGVVFSCKWCVLTTGQFTVLMTAFSKVPNPCRTVAWG